MVAVVGTYKDGYVTLEKEYPSEKPLNVIVTFLEEVEATPQKRLSLSDFSFAKSREILKDVKGSFSDAVIEERRSEL